MSNIIRDQEYMLDFVATVLEAWKKSPELRFGQLLYNLTPHTSIYYANDNFVKETAEKHQGTNWPHVSFIPKEFPDLIA